MGKTEKTLISKKEYRSYNTDTVLLSVGLLAVGFFINGSTVLYQAAVCLFSSAICEYLCFALMLRKKSFTDLGFIASALLIALLLPSSAPLFVGALASAFAVIAAKLPFGDGRNAPFLPAAAGFCFVAVLFPEQTFTYAAEGFTAVFSSAEGFEKGKTLLDMLSEGNSIRLNLFGFSRLLSGTLPGATGTTSLLALFGVFLYRMLRKPFTLLSSASFIVSAALFALVFPTVTADIATGIISELCAGSLIFTALMLINDPVTSPAKPLRAIAYGFIGGIISMLLRRFGSIYDPCVFSVLIMNLLWPAFTGETVSNKLLPKAKVRKQKRSDQKKSEKKAVGEYVPAYDLFSEEKGGADE